MTLLMRLRRWVQHPPSPAQAKVVLAILAIGAVFVGVDLAFGWPEWLTPNDTGRRGVSVPIQAGK